MPLKKVHDWDGKIIAYCEYGLVDKLGLPYNKGEYIYVFEIWVHEKFRRKGIIRRFVKEIIEDNPTARYSYWKRHKYKDRIRLFNKEKLHGWRNNRSTGPSSSNST